MIFAVLDALIWGMPLFGALIGWGTNWLAIRMLFYPRKRISLLGYPLQGLIPKRRSETARKVGQIVHRELLSEEVLRAEIRKIDLRPHLDAFAHRMVQGVLARRLQSIPLLGSMIRRDSLFMIEQIVVRQLEREAPHILDHVSRNLDQHIDVQALVEKQVLGFDLDRLERVVKSIAHREFRAIEALGALVGFLIGLLQVVLLTLFA